MLLVEILLTDQGEPNQQVEISFDEGGLDFLIDRLTRLKQQKTDHYHLMSESWGDGDLDEQTHSSNSLLVHHLKLLKVVA